MCDLSLHGLLRVCQKGGEGEGRGCGRDCSLTLCISVRWGRGKEVMGNFLDMIFYGVQCFLLRRVVQL